MTQKIERPRKKCPEMEDTCTVDYARGYNQSKLDHDPWFAWVMEPLENADIFMPHDAIIETIKRYRGEHG